MVTMNKSEGVSARRNAGSANAFSLVAIALLVLGGCSSENDAPANDDAGTAEDAAVSEDSGAGDKDAGAVDSGPADSGVACKKGGGSCKVNSDCCSDDCHSGHCH